MKIALVSGGNSELGGRIAKDLSLRGFSVIITYTKDKGKAELVVKDIEATGQEAACLQLEMDLIKTFPDFAKNLKSILKTKWDRDSFDVFINNAGTVFNASFENTTEEQFDMLYRTHLKGTFFIIQKLLPLIHENGRILNISTGLTRFCIPGFSAYAAMKGGVEVLTKYLAKELGDRGITVNTLATSATITDKTKDDKELSKTIASQTALGRMGVTSDVSAVVCSMVSDDMYWINGQRVEASGGVKL